jgi:thiol-disulfide isomerase/thioredoxin
LLIAVAVLAVAAVAGLIWRVRSGRLHVSEPARVPAGILPEPAGAVTLLQFSSATCAPCRQVRAACADLAGGLNGVRHVEIDAEERLDAARALNVWRLPTLLVVDREGRVARRAVGVPDRTELKAAVTEVLAR